MPTGRPLTYQLKQQVVKTYLDHPITLQLCSKQFGLSSPTIAKILDEYKISRYHKVMLYNPELDEHYFHFIDSPQKAYFLGLLLTDGNVFRSQPNQHSANAVSLTLCDDDSYLLDAFSKAIKSQRKITSDGRGCSTISICSRTMCDDLAKYGIVPQKTLTVRLPQINQLYMSHLIRGIIDGDGCIRFAYYPKIRKYVRVISICGTEQLMYDISHTIYDILGIKSHKIYTYTNRHLSETRYNATSDIIKLGEWLYQDADIYLKRKYQKYLEIKNHYLR